MNCPLCATPNREGASFCASCGASLGSGPLTYDPLTNQPLPACDACNAALRPGAQFCHRCGQAVSQAAQPAPDAEAAFPCANCGWANRPSARFCGACRAPLVVACANCGADNRATARYCLICGQPVSGPLTAASEATTGSSLIAPVDTVPPPRRSGGLSCEFCGEPSHAGARFCSQCGKTPNSRLLPFQAMYSTGMMPRGHQLRGADGDEYFILRLIAQGGMGAVYEVGRLKDGTHWAMKEMSETAFSRGDRAATVAKFRQEADLLRELRHENLPRVIDVFEFDHRHYLVMQLVEGRTLGELLDANAGPLPEKDVVEWGAQLCRVLAFLHTRLPPIIYRDLKPDNVMLDATDGRIKLIDFGIARRFKGGKRSDTFMLGTKGYAAPEQFGKRESDARTDLFALGATLHHLLTGENPTNRQLFAFPPLETYPHLRLSRRTCEAIRAAVELDPDARPVDAAAFYKALTGKTMPPPPPPTRPPAEVLPPPIKEPVRSQPAGKVRLLDLGTVRQGETPSGRLRVGAAAARLAVESRAAWLSAPDALAPGETEVKVTARTQGLALAREDWPVGYQPRYGIDWLWWLVLWLYGRHARLFVPAPRRHEAAVRVGGREHPVAVTVAPAPDRVSLGRWLSVAAVAVEVAVLAVAIGYIIMRLS